MGKIKTKFLTFTHKKQKKSGAKSWKPETAPPPQTQNRTYAHNKCRKIRSWQSYRLSRPTTWECLDHDSTHQEKKKNPRFEMKSRVLTVKCRRWKRKEKKTRRRGWGRKKKIWFETWAFELKGFVGVCVWTVQVWSRIE